jgi:hypothetical protein
MGLMLLFVVVQSLLLAKYMHDEPGNERGR